MRELSTPNVSVVIVSWNSAPHLSRCLASLAAQSYQDFEVIVVDNASTDQATAELAHQYPGLNLRVERLETNVGFASGNNVGVKYARGDWLALLNPDAFPQADWLEQLLKAAALYADAFFASRQVQAERPELLDGEGDAYHVSGLAWRLGYNSAALRAGPVREVFSACAAAALIPRADFLEVGGFDADYFAYQEDVDLGFRLRLHGLKCILVPSAIVQHVGYASSSRRSDLATYYGHRNLVWTYVKDMPSPFFWLYLPLHLMMNAISLAYFMVAGKSRVIWRAKLDAGRGLRAALRKRRAVQEARRIPLSRVPIAMNRSLLGPLAGWRTRHHSPVS